MYIVNNLLTPVGLEMFLQIIDKMECFYHLDFGTADIYELNEYDSIAQKLIQMKNWHNLILFGYDYN